MMTDKDPCPETARVQVMVEGTLSEEDHGAMALHLENCEPCQERFEQLMREVDCFSEVARELGGELRTKDTALEQVIQALHTKGTGQKDGGELPSEATDGEPASSEDLLLDFLDPSDDPDHLGRLGPYEVIEVVGRGGMGVVLKGHDDRLNRVVAIKVLHPRLAINATARKRFRRESRAAAAVSHDHVVTIHAVEEVDGLPILVMEYVEGVSLQQRIKENGPLMLEEILRVGMQAASGLAAAHAQGIIHRDVKPSNILLENGVERVKLTDFGLARAVDDVHLTKSGVLAGTPQYMSPEQAHAEPVDGRSDLFSLGCVLYACCTGRSPFRADSTMAALRRVCEDTPRPIREINPDIPDWLVEIIDRLLTKDRDQRFESASDVAELLGEHLAHLQHPTDVPQPARLKPPATAGPSRPNRFLRRRWIAAAAAAVLVLVAGLGVTEGTGLTRVVATVIKVWTPHGTLIIETDDPDIEIAISGDGEEVIFTGAGVRRITVPIDVLFEVKGKKDGDTFFREVVRITRNGERVTRVRVAPPKLDTVILAIGESEKPVEVNVSEDKEITITDPNDGQKIRITVERGKQTLTLRKAGFATETTRFNLKSKDGRRVCVTFVPKYVLPNGWVIREPVNLGPIVNSRFEDTAPAISADGLTLLFSSGRPGGEGESDLWMCTRASVRESFGEPVNLGPTVNSSSLEFGPAVSADGLTLLFGSNRPGGQGAVDLWMCRRASVGESFGKPVNLGPTVNSSSLDGTPAISADGLTLLFKSERPGGHSACDLWMCRRASVGESFGRPVNLGPTVNSSSNHRATVSADGLTLLFCSDRLGGANLWMCTRASVGESFGRPINLGPTVNSNFRDSGPTLSTDNLTLLFDSDRPGGQGGRDLWWARIEHREIPSTEKESEAASTPRQPPPTPPRPAIADKAKKPLTTAELLAKLSAEEQAALAEFGWLRSDILLIDRIPAKPALVGHFHNRPDIRWRLQHLKVLTNMHYLNLRKCQMSDTHLEDLADLDELQYLFLDENPVTDAGLERLKRLTNLQILGLEKTQVSAAGVMELQKALPECLIEWPRRVRREPPSTGAMSAEEKTAVAELCLLGADIVSIDRGPARPALVCLFRHKKHVANHLQPISMLTNMCLLELHCCDVADADLEHLATLSGFQYLKLHGNKVTDEGLKHLKCLTELRVLRLSERQVTDAGLEQLSGLVKLQSLEFYNMPINGTGLRHLKGLDGMTNLWLSACRISDTGLKHVSWPTNLQILNLGGTQVTGAGLEHLAGLTNLQSLNLRNTQVTDAGLEHLAELTNLQKLLLGNTQVTDAGLEHLAEATNLQRLYLVNTQVTDRGLKHLSPLTNLQGLKLNNTQVTDAGLEHLRGLTNLQFLELDNTRVTTTGVTHLRKALPDCQIRWPSYDVPEGGVDELLQFIENLKQFHPATPQERAEYQSKAPAALKLAAQRILAQDKDPWSKPCQTALRALLEIRITDIPQTDRQQQGETVEFVKTFLKGKLERQLESLDVDLARSAAQALETCRNLELAAQAYDQFADLIAESGNKEFSKTVKDMKDAAKRLSNAER